MAPLMSAACAEMNASEPNRSAASACSSAHRALQLDRSAIIRDIAATSSARFACPVE
jgi:hypothetical protein